MLPSDLTNKGNVRSYHRLRQPSVATWDERPTTGSDEGNSSKGIACPEQPITRAHENWGSLILQSRPSDRPSRPEGAPLAGDYQAATIAPNHRADSR